MKTLRPFLRLAAALASASLLAASAHAADLTVNQGDSQTISANATYDAVVVNGNLTVAPNVTLNCTSLLVANYINGTATITVGDGATINVTGVISGNYSVKLGTGTGRAEVYLGNGATFSAAKDLHCCAGYTNNDSPAAGDAMTEALLVVGPGATVRSGTRFCFGDYDRRPSGTPQSAIKAVVRLDEGAVLSAPYIIDWLPVSKTILFNGGKIASQTTTSSGGGFVQMAYNSRYTTMYFEGTNECPIVADLSGRGALSAFVTFASSACKFQLRGDGDFIKTGSGAFPLINGGSWDSNNPNLQFLLTGDFVVREGAISVSTVSMGDVLRPDSNATSRPIDLVVEGGATFDLAGCDIGLNSITAAGSGLVTNSAAGTATATIGVRNDGRGSTLSRVFPGIAFVKQGSASLTLCGSEIDSLDIRGGTLVVKDRAAMGYPLYRFKFDRTGMDDNASINNAMRLREIAFLANGQDATCPYSKAHYDMSGTSWITNPERLFDGNLDTVYEDYRMHKAIDDSDRDRVQISLEYTECKVFDEYRLAPFYSSEFQWQLNPTAWRVFGGFSPDGGDLLDQVTGYSVVEVDGWTSTNFVLSCPVSPALHVGTLSLGNGAKVEATGAQVTCGTFSGSATGVKLDLSSGAALPLTANQSVSEITVDLTEDLATVAVLNPEANGTLHVTGDRRSVKGALLYADSCPNASRLSSWTVYLNGNRLDNGLCYDDGAVRLLPLATVLYMR